MRIFSPQLLIGLAASLALVATGCADDSSTNPQGGPGIVTGHLDDDSGNQSVTPNLNGGASASTNVQAGVKVVEVGTVDSTGTFQSIGSVDVATDGTFRLEGVELPAGEPLLVEGKASATAQANAMAIIQASDADERVSTALSQETTVEAKTFLALVADGHSPSTIDTASLMTWITAEVAASSNNHADVLADAFVQAQAAWTATASGLSTTFNASAAADARAEAFGTLAIALDSAVDAAAESRAWSDFMTEVGAAVRNRTGLSASAMADADAAAAIVFESEVAAGIGANAEGHARGIGAIISGHSALAAQLDAEGSGSASAAIETKLEAAYTAMFAGIGSATTTEAMADVVANLGVALSGHGVGQRDDSVLGLLIDAQGSGTTAAQVETAIAATATASATFETSATSALSAHDGTAVGNAMVSLRTATSTSINATLSSASTLRSFVSDVAVQLNGQANVQFGLSDLLSVVTELGITINGELLADLGLQTGADGIVDDLDGAVIANAATAAVVTFDATTGAMVTLATGVMTNASGDFEITDVPQVDGPAAIAIFDSEGELVASTLIAAGIDGQSDLQTAPITIESTVEAMVVAHLMGRGMSYADIDVADVFASVDAAVAASAMSEDQVGAVAEGIMVSQMVRAEALATTGAEMHDATLQAAVTLQTELAAGTQSASEAYAMFEANVDLAVSTAAGATTSSMSRIETHAQLAFRATVEAIASSSSRTSEAVDARARLENALSLEASASAMMTGMTAIDSERQTELSAAVEAFVSATASAQDRAGLDAAGMAFEEAMIGFTGTIGSETGLLGGIIATDLGLSVALQASIEAGFDLAFQAATTWSTAVGTGIMGATSGDQVDGAAAVTVVTTASATYEAAVSAALSLDAALDLSTEGHHLVLELGTQVAGGLYAE